jgi:glycosyltransferase involved in cell wall biosynthesis
MKSHPFFSICIPVYKNTDYLKRLLDSVLSQTFSDFEIVITDDSPDDVVQSFLQEHFPDMGIRYFRNAHALGTPENWNEGIRQANGEWIKLMHDDDWFTSDRALEVFFNHIQQKPTGRFFFSAFQNVHSSNQTCEVVRMTSMDLRMLKWNELHLFKKVYVGNPSCTVVKKDVGLLYHKQYKFVVDFEYYIRVIRQTGSWHYIDDVLLNVGFNDEQVTVYTKYNPAVQVPENHALVRQFGQNILNNFFVFDYYWRMYRNVGIRSLEQAAKYDSGVVPTKLGRMIHFQSVIPVSVLKMGPVSKILMACCYAAQRLGL